MPLKAIDVDTGKAVYSFSYATKLEIRDKHPNLKCPFSGVEMYPRQRSGYVLHFVRKGVKEIPFDFHPESVQHSVGKELLYREVWRHINKADSKFANCSAEIEYPVSIEGREKGRIADVMILDGGNKPIFAIEIQLSPITPEELEQRTLDYESQEIDVIWYFGDKAATEVNRNWAFKNLGRFDQISFPDIQKEESDDPYLKEALLNAV